MNVIKDNNCKNCGGDEMLCFNERIGIHCVDCCDNTDTERCEPLYNIGIKISD